MPNGSSKAKVIAPRESDQAGHPVPRNAYDRQRVQKNFSEGQGRTEQSHVKACDINNIMARFQKTGAIQHLAKHPPQYGDVTGADFQSAQMLIAEQKTIFEELPSKLRAVFENDPSQYLDFVTDEANADFLEKQGLQGLLPTEESRGQETAPEDVSAPEPDPAEPASVTE